MRPTSTNKNKRLWMGTSYIMWLEWRDGRISFIRDYRYVRYVTADAELTLSLEVKPPDDGAAQ